MKKSFRAIHLHALFCGYAQPYPQYLWIKICRKTARVMTKQLANNFSIFQSKAAHLLEMLCLAESLVAG